MSVVAPKELGAGRVLLAENSDGFSLRAVPQRLGPREAVFELYNSSVVLRASEVLQNLQILSGETLLYRGRAVIKSLVNTGLTTVCEVALEAPWMEVPCIQEGHRDLSRLFGQFVDVWRKDFRISDEYKLIVAEMESFLSDLHLWLEQIELGIRSSPTGDRARMETDVLRELQATVIRSVDDLWAPFEEIAGGIEPERQAAYREYLRRRLHPLLLCSPFAFRSFQKPLGYAGDYDVVNMIMSDPYRGSSLFSKMINVWLLSQPPAEAHRHRIAYLAERLWEQILRRPNSTTPVKVLSLACGPAVELQRLLRTRPVRVPLELTLLDFNEETLRHTREALEGAIEQTGSRVTLRLLRKPVQHLLRPSGHRDGAGPAPQYDVIYCAGLFDYLPDLVCRKLQKVMWDWLTPGGLSLITNVSKFNAFRYSLEHILDWYLIARNTDELRALVPAGVPAEAVDVKGEPTGANLFLGLRKPDHG